MYDVNSNLLSGWTRVKIIKFIVLEILLLIIILLFGTVVMKILYIWFKIEYENILAVGFKVGFIAWLLLVATTYICKLKKLNHNLKG